MFLDKSKLQEVCSDLLADLDSLVSLKWDKRFQAFLAEFSTKDEDNIRSVIEKHLTQMYDRKTIKKAPQDLIDGGGLFSDIRSNQLLFSSDPDSSVLILAAWWPWDDGELISLRVLSPDPDAEVEPPKKPGILSRIIEFIID